MGAPCTALCLHLFHFEVFSFFVINHTYLPPFLAISSYPLLFYFCSLKRGILYGCCRREGYNVLALGQHLDDFAESFIMSSFRNGLLRTMKAHYLNDDGEWSIMARGLKDAVLHLLFLRPSAHPSVHAALAGA